MLVGLVVVFLFCFVFLHTSVLSEIYLDFLYVFVCFCFVFFICFYFLVKSKFIRDIFLTVYLCFCSIDVMSPKVRDSLNFSPNFSSSYYSCSAIYCYSGILLIVQCNL